CQKVTFGYAITQKLGRVLALSFPDGHHYIDFAAIHPALSGFHRRHQEGAAAGAQARSLPPIVRRLSSPRRGSAWRSIVGQSGSPPPAPAGCGGGEGFHSPPSSLLPRIRGRGCGGMLAPPLTPFAGGLPRKEARKTRQRA